MVESDAPKERCGLLSQTVIHSPTIQWVLPARIRHSLRNDVVFVGERSIQVKEALCGMYLEDVAVKSDFDAKITAARVLNVRTELSWETQMKLRAGHAPPSDPSELNGHLPSQILVLALMSKELVFLYCTEHEPTRFVHCSRPLPSEVSSLERFGRHLAVDTRGRAIAIAASTDFFGILMLRPASTLQSQMARQELNPVSEERFFRVDGDILFMEFLYPKADDSETVTLLLLVSKDHLTYAMCYHWDATKTLRQHSPKVTSRQLPPEDALPSIVAPLTKESSFLLVSPLSIAVYRNLAVGKMHPLRYPIPITAGESRRSPLWTRWARPSRNWLYNQKHDDIYLCREDGRLHYLEIGANCEIEQQTYLGQLCPDVDAAFDVLDVDYEGADLLIAAGNMGDGGLFVQRARDRPRCVQRFSNWAPVTDSVMIRSRDEDAGGHAASSNRLFVCSGSTDGRGAIVELRRGMEAQIGLVLGMDELSSAGNIWAMADPEKGGVRIIVSDPMSTLLLYLPLDDAEEVCAIDDSSSGLDGSGPTLAVGCTQNGALIQVTERAIRIGGTLGIHPRACWEREMHEAMTVAAIDASGSMVAAAVRVDQQVCIELTKIVYCGDEYSMIRVGNPIPVEKEPVCLMIEHFGPTSFIFVGASNGTLTILRIHDDAVTYLSTYFTELTGQDDFSLAIVSMARISFAVDSTRESTLLCGLRCGYICPFEVLFDDSDAVFSVELKASAPIPLGKTAVKLLGGAGFALATCGEMLWHVSNLENNGRRRLSLERVWITDQNNPAYCQKGIEVFTLLNVLPNSVPNPQSGSLYCITEEQLFVCTLSHNTRTVPRRIDLPGSAVRLAYSEHLRSLIVGYSITEYDTLSNPIKRYTRTTIDFVDPDGQDAILGAGESQSHAHSVRGWRPQGAAGEKITCILEWFPRRGDEQYHLVVIGTARKDGDLRGRVIFLQVFRNPTESTRIKCVVKKIHKLSNPVYAVAPYSESSLMVATGSEIVPLEHSFSNIKFAQGTRYALLSPARSITVHEPYVYVSTARESLVVLKVVDSKLVLHAHDRVKREGLSHIHLPAGPGIASATLATSKAGTVGLFMDEGHTDRAKLLPIAQCEAHLPLSVTKLLYPNGTGSHQATIYGTTMDGAIFRFGIVPEDVMLLYRFLQNLAMRDPTISPFSPKRKKKFSLADIEPSINKPTHTHIDGDILCRLADNGAAHLRRMLSTAGDVQPVVEGTVEENRIRERFGQLATALLPHSDDLVADVIGMLRESLQVTL